jgi:hypothetical protein
MNKFTHFLGIDISKEYFDAVIILEGKKELNNHNQFANNAGKTGQIDHPIPV